MPIDPETRAYLDEVWTMRRLESGTCAPFALYGSDGDPIAVLSCHNAAHFLTPEAVGEYLMELHANRQDSARLEWLAAYWWPDHDGTHTDRILSSLLAVDPEGFRREIDRGMEDARMAATLSDAEAAEPGFAQGGSTRQKVRRMRGGEA